MRRPLLLSRRRLLAAAVSAAGFGAFPGLARQGLADEKPPSDRGIGGTGLTSEPGEGAIGFIGSIQRFGSIFVNGSRIAYRPDALVVIDGRKSGPHDLIIGQVVKTVARRSGGGLKTDHIEVLSEVVGPVEALEGRLMIVLGQRVDCGTTGTDAFAIGDRLAVSGIRQLDGTILARLIQPADWRMDQVVGPARFEGWTLRVGDLQLLGPDARYAGARIVARGSRIATGLKVTSIALDRLPDPAGVTALSIEAFAARRGGDVQLGSGFVFSAAGVWMRSVQGTTPAYLDIGLGDPGSPPMGGDTSHGPRSGQPAPFDGWRPGMAGDPADQGGPRAWGGAAPPSWPDRGGTAGPPSGTMPGFGHGGAPLGSDKPGG